jgi:single-stranded-DNA-specific exonuclease
VGDDLLKGSGRSIPGLHLRDALDRVATRHPGLVEKFGGHAMAAGLSLAKSDLEAFRAALNSVVAETLSDVPPESIEDSDGELAPGDFSVQLAEQLVRGGPWGQHFPEPMFDGVFTVSRHRIVGDRHLKMTLTIDSVDVEAIAFNVDVDEWLNQPLERIRALYRLDINEFRGDRNAQLVIDSFWRPEP